jgi:hypothetical protein
MRFGEHSIPSDLDGVCEGAPVGDRACECFYSDCQVGGDAGLAEECGQLVEVDQEGASGRGPAREEVVTSLTLFGCRVSQRQSPNEFTTEFQSSAQSLA